MRLLASVARRTYPLRMTAPTPYLSFAGDARDALTFYRGVFGGELQLHTYADLGRTDAAPERTAQSIAHGELSGPVDLFASDAAPGEATLESRGILFALLGTADPSTLEGWFTALADGGDVVDPLTRKPWGDHDGQVRDRYGVTWLIGYRG